MRPANLNQSGGRQNRRTCYRRTYGLHPDEIRREIRRLAARGWQVWELNQVFQPCPCDDQERAA